jgi:hypothetical protein
MKRALHISTIGAITAVLFVALTAASPLVAPAWAHNDFELTAAAGYRLPFGGKMNLEDSGGGELEEGHLSFKGAFIFTGMAAYRLRPDGFIYLSYTRGLHQVEFAGSAEGIGFDFTGSRTVEYFQFGGNVEMTRGRFVPYMGVSLGMGRVGPGGGNDARLFFAPVLDPGIKFDLHEHVHLRLMGRVPLLFANKNLVCVPEGCAHADKITPLPQLEILGGAGVSF